MGPKARDVSLRLSEVGEELVVYDQTDHRMHCLNRATALLWRHCDGQRTIADLATVLHETLDVPVDERLVWLTLEELQEANLLETPIDLPPGLASVTRRRVLITLRRTAAAALLLPALTSIVAPTAMAAASNGGGGSDACRDACFSTLASCTSGCSNDDCLFACSNSYNDCVSGCP